MISGLDLKESSLYITRFDELDNSFLENDDRDLYFEVYWLEDKKLMYLIPPLRNYRFKKALSMGTLIAFNKDLLVYEAQEFSLTVFNFFSRHGDFSTVFLDDITSASLTNILNIIKEEHSQVHESNILLLRTLLKAFLLKLMTSSEQQLISPDLHEKRVYHFLSLLENHYTTERSVNFYAEKLSLSSKRLNQILKEKVGKTISQLLQERLLLEAKHLLFVGTNNIKEISFSLGFEDPSYFSRFFKKMTKLSPEEFRAENKSLFG